ncbi:hypothetical protein Tco_1080533 [Tanacetum coccineum]|uniref:Uncharacterized protein n=1 Tax=Tanacetum coccineum TaxID=301880 RepID=A0ABQ5HWV8_9ASTR
MIIKKDSEIVKAKIDRKSLALKAKKESSEEECSTFESEDEEYVMALRDLRSFFKKRDLIKIVYVDARSLIVTSLHSFYLINDLKLGLRKGLTRSKWVLMGLCYPLITLDINGTNKSGERATDEAKQGMFNSYLIKDNSLKVHVSALYNV